MSQRKKQPAQNEALSIIEQFSDRKPDRMKISLYISAGIYKDFQDACKPAPASRIMEALMSDFIKTVKLKNSRR
jgi:hypothetical protein